MDIATRQFGLLCAGMKRFSEASAASSMSGLLRPSNNDGQYALAASAYVSEDPILAAWAPEQADYSPMMLKY